MGEAARVVLGGRADFEVNAWVRAVCEAKLSRGARRVARLLASHPSFPKRFPPLGRIAELLDPDKPLSRDQVRYYLRELERAGLVQRNTEPQQPTTYASLRKRRRAAWRTLVLCADDLKCVDCGAGERLEAHHIIPVRLAPAMAFEVANGVTLCARCHLAIYGRESEHAERFRAHVEVRHG